MLVLRARREAIVNAPPCTSGLGAGAPGRGEVPVDGEAVEVLAPGPQPAELDVHGVATVRAGGRGVATGGPREAVVLGDLPGHLVDPRGHAAHAVVGEWGPARAWSR